MQHNLFPTRGEMEAEIKEGFLSRLHAEHEAVCPCCDRIARISKLRVHSTLAFMLCRLYRISMGQNGRHDEWVHLERFSPDKHGSGRDFCILKHWNLVEAMPADYAEDKRSSGLWRLTDTGRDFIEKKITIPRILYVFDRKILDASDEVYSIIQALGDKFSYWEVLSR